MLCADGRFAVRRQRVVAHSECLLQLVQACLRDCSVSLSDVGGIACSAGPGSFTGLRIGMATAKGLCFALGVPLITVSSLEALAGIDGLLVQQRPILVVLNAFRGQLFARLIPSLPGSVDADATAQLLARTPHLAVDAMWQPTALQQAVQPLQGRFILRSTAPLPSYAQPLAALASHLSLDSESDPAPSVQHSFPSPPLALARLAHARLLAGHGADLFSAVPNYLCGSAPEEAERQRALSNPTPAG